jgi:hypothetical protein
MTKAFESMFGGVTCLPGCFSMYRIKAPKGASGYWVPILANPDIVEHYSENVVDTLHKKNLLLLGEDRYLTTLMLKTFPMRKNLFLPSAVCKTVVPDTFRVLISQRRRWINSTVHNLAELVLVRDLCGTFCFSMQFVVGMELAGTLVLPAAISFTIYLIISSVIPRAHEYHDPSGPFGCYFGSARVAYRYHLPQDRIRRLDDSLSLLSSYMERHSSRLCILAFRRLFMGPDTQGVRG